MKDLTALSDAELDAEHMAIQEARAKAEAGFKAQATAVQAERDRRGMAARIAAVDPDVIAAIRARSEEG